MKSPDVLIQLIALKEQIEDLIDQSSTTPKNAKAPKPAKPTNKRGTRGTTAAAAVSNNRLAIVVGHSAAAPGASGVAPISASEYTWNSDLAQRIKTFGASKGVDVAIFFRDGVGISGAYAAVRTWGARAAIELHFNAANGIAKGTETLHGTAANALPWAEAVQKAMVALYGRTGIANRGLKQCPPHPRGGTSVNAVPSIPTSLIEPFFGDSPTDAALGQTKKQALAEALLNAFKSHFGV